ncbi:LysE family translocator [Undibacterium sp. JH2W]|uniref:LysE family translocator n=1 Tax=Undibacterium sp. JH2W TaxID=3413037 RepID=UPI003BEFA2EE
MLETINFPGFILAASLVIILPGPATLLVAELARHSLWRAAAAVAGIVLGDIVLISLSAAGFALLMQGLSWLMPALRLLGAAYLLYLGVQLLRRPAGAALGAEPGHAGFLRGLLITVGNPKPVLFFSSFFPLFLPAAQDQAVPGFILLGSVFEAINLLYFSCLCSLLHWSGRQVTSRAWLPAGAMQKICGCGLILCGVGLVWQG